MAQDLDDDIVDVQPPSQEASGDDDDIVDVQAPPGILDRLMSKGSDLVTPSEDTKELAGDVADTGLDFAKNAAKGLSFNTLDELGGLAGAGIESGLGALGIGPAAVDAQLAEQGFKGAEESFSDKYRGYQQGIEQNLEEAQERSPIASTLGEIAGGATSGIPLGRALGLGGAAGKAESIADIARNSGKAKAAMELLKRGGANYAKAAPAIAAESALTSKEQLIGPDANPAGVAADVAGGLAFGGATMGGMGLIGDVVAPYASQKYGQIANKVSNAMDENPLARQFDLFYKKYGQEYKVNPRNRTALKEGIPGVEGGTPFSLLDTQRATGVADDVIGKDSQLGAMVGDALDNSTVMINAKDILDQTFKDINQLALEMPSFIKDPRVNHLLTKLQSRNYVNASSRDIKNAIEDITNSIDQIKGYKLASPELEDAVPILHNLRKNLDVRLKDKNKPYAKAAERFAQYRSTFIEQPINGRFDPELSGTYYGTMKKGDEKLVKAYEDIIKQSGGDSQSSEAAEGAYAKLLQRAKEFQDAEKVRVAKGEIDAPITEDPMKFMKKIEDFSYDSSARNANRDVKSTQAGTSLMAKSVAGVANTGKGALLTGGYLAGRAKASSLSQSIAKTSRAIYKAPAQSLSNLATKLESQPSLSAVGKALREGLENGDSAKKNAALFTIMQNPNARAFISAEDFPDEEEK